MQTIKKIPTQIMSREVSCTCDNCDKKLKHDAVASRNSYQFEEALFIKLGGGYGMYYDSLFNDSANVILCKKCANKLLKVFPCFKSAIAGTNVETIEYSDLPSAKEKPIESCTDSK